MNQRNESNKPQAVKINITIPLPEKVQAIPPKPPCSDCSACGKCGQNVNNNALWVAGETMIKLLTGQYSPEQIGGALEMLDVMLRKYYESKQ
jgi:hypothetical protein